MAVIEVCPITTWLEANKEGYRVYKQIWHVITDDKDDGPITALQASGLPQPGDAYLWGHDSDLWSTCDPIPDVRWEKQDQAYRKKWILTYNFTNEPRWRCQTGQIESPLDEPWEVEGGSDEWEEDSDTARDVNGNGPYGIINSALERIEITVPKTRRNLVLKKNYAWIVQDWIGIYEGAVNSVAITILGKTYPARTLRIRKITFTRKRYGVCNYYYPVTFNIDIDFNTFDFIIPNRSYYRRLNSAENAGETTAPSPPTDPIKHFTEIVDKKDKGRRVQHFIDQNGDVIKPDANGNITPTYRRWRKFVELPFAIFGFPPTG